MTLGVIGLVAGWLLRPIALHTGLVEPQVSWAQIALIFFVVAIVSGSAYLTRRTVARSRHDLDHRQAVNRLVLGKACALAGAAFGGGYLGYAVSQLGVSDPMASTRLWHAALAGIGGLLVLGAALLLEQACRIRPDGE